MRAPSLKLAALLSLGLLAGSPVWAQCEGYAPGQGPASLQLLTQYQDNCLGQQADTAPITETVDRLIAEVDVSDRALRSSADVAAIRERTAEIMDRIAASMARVDWEGPFRQAYAAARDALGEDRDAVRAGEPHPAEHWNLDQLVIPAAQTDLQPLLEQSCAEPESSGCRAAFAQASQLVRHATLLRRVLFESNAHIPELTDRYRELDAQWDYYFGEARSQYIWELALNGYLYERSLVAECRDDADTELEGRALREYCRDRKDVRLSPPPRGQWILLHPGAALEYVADGTGGESATSAVAIVEVIGYNRFADSDGDPLLVPIGGSLITTISLDSRGDRIGYGGMVHLWNTVSLGVARREFGDRAEATFLLSTDLARLFLKVPEDLRRRVKFLD